MNGLELARRPEATLGAVLRSLQSLGLWDAAIPSGLALSRIDTAIKYAAFIDKEEREASRHRTSAGQALDPDLDYETVPGLRIEATQRLNAARPLTIGQASRTPGVTPGDISALLVHLARVRKAEPMRSHRAPTQAAQETVPTP